MNAIYLELVARLGIDLALIVIKNLGSATSNEQAIIALENIKTSQEYVDADAALRNIPAVPLPSLDPIPPDKPEM